MKEYEVIYIEFELKSFQWSNGYYFIIKEEDGVCEMCKLEKGEPQRYDDGRYMICCTGSGNKGIQRTNLKYHEYLHSEKWEEDFQEGIKDFLQKMRNEKEEI